MRILNCHTQGGEIGRNFSVFNAKLACGQTIEQLYQSAKRDASGKSYPKGQEKGKPACFMHVCGENVPCTGTFSNKRFRYTWYTMLWQTWFFENPDKWTQACEYAGFVDKFDGARGVVYMPGDDYQPKNGRCAQSASIAYLVGRDNDLGDVPEIVSKSYAKYWHVYHPNCMQLVLK